MKTLKITLALLFASTLFVSCTQQSLDENMPDNQNLKNSRIYTGGGASDTGTGATRDD